MPHISYCLAVLIGYFLGSLPTAFLVVRWKTGLDIRRAGSGNVGALNSYEVTGSRLTGILVMVVDCFKGGLASWLGGIVAPGFEGASLAGLAAVAGHNFPLWLRFRGGRGLATAAGVLAAICWKLLPVWGAGWVIGFAITRRVNPANAIASVIMLALVLAMPAFAHAELLPGGATDGRFEIFCGVLSGLVLVKHIKPVKEYLIEQSGKKLVDFDKEVKK